MQEGSTNKILDHPFFAALDLTQLKNGTLAPEFIPEPQVCGQHGMEAFTCGSVLNLPPTARFVSKKAYHEPISTLKPVKAFSGDQKQFKDF